MFFIVQQITTSLHRIVCGERIEAHSNTKLTTPNGYRSFSEFQKSTPLDVRALESAELVPLKETIDIKSGKGHEWTSRTTS